MKDQPRGLNQTWPVACKWCHFTNAPKNFRALPANTSNFGPLFLDFRTWHRISPEWNVASTNRNTNLQCVPYKLTYFSWPLIQKRLRVRSQTFLSIKARTNKFHKSFLPYCLKNFTYSLYILRDRCIVILYCMLLF